jgi:hypothetical protein
VWWMFRITSNFRNDVSSLAFVDVELGAGAALDTQNDTCRYAVWVCAVCACMPMQCVLPSGKRGALWALHKASALKGWRYYRFVASAALIILMPPRTISGLQGNAAQLIPIWDAFRTDDAVHPARSTDTEDKVGG